MVHFKMLFGFILISCVWLVNCELTMENVVGGTLATIGSFGYQVGVIGKRNGTYARFYVCNAGIISNYFVLGDSECFIDANNQLKKMRYFVVVGSRNLRFHYNNAIDVVYIFVFTEQPITNGHNIAVLQVADSLNINFNFDLKSLTLPVVGVHYSSPAAVAGYGVTSLYDKVYYSGRGKPKLTELKDFFLMHLSKDIVGDTDCKDSYDNIQLSKQFCAKVNQMSQFEVRGLCVSDEGAPLVVETHDVYEGVQYIVLGIANKNRADCDNNVHGHIYTKVSAYLPFINGVLRSNYIPETVTLINRHQVNVKV